jgi:hypothetical protein
MDGMQNQPAAAHNENWRELYEATLIELDTARLAALIHRTRSAIFGHMQHLKPNDISERHVLLDALSTLEALRRMCGDSERRRAGAGE